MKQSAVEWLQEALSLTFEQEMKFEGLFQQAKEMEKQQIFDGWNDGFDRGLGCYYAKFHNSEQYYNETFKKI